MNEERGYYEPQGVPKIEKRTYTKTQRWLLLGAVAIGAVFSWVLFADTLLETTLRMAGLRYAIFWFVYAVCFYVFTWKTSSRKTLGWLLHALALWLMARYLVYEERNLNALDFLAIPLVLMLGAVECTAIVPNERQGEYILAYIRGFFVAPFISIGRFFGAAGSAFGKKAEDPRRRAVRVGLIIGFLLALVVVPLLISADDAVRLVLENIFRNIRLGPTVLRLIFALVVAVLFYSFIFHHAYEQRPGRADPCQKRFSGAGVAAAVGVLLGIYALFAAFQFTYLTGLAGLPEGLTYSEYAVRGFSELCAVASINLVAFALCVTFTEEGKTLRGMMLGLLGATVVLLGSALARLVMYIEAYGLTINRILPFWFMLFLFALIGLCAVKLFVPRMKLLRLAAGTFAAFYFALSLLNLDVIAAKSVLARAEAQGRLERSDADFLRYTLSADAAKALHESPLKYEIYYDVAPEDVDKLD
ncbi:MAG TPA: DUF4173 domain-containing protein [Clostridia bacterium]|nr:DUF4173 domain-containing protein [Clostridia bacterium]